MSEAGRPSDLTEELTLQIRKMVLDSIEYKTIQETLGISPNTWDSWVYRDTQGFRALLSQWKKERMIKKAEVKVDVLMDSEDDRVALNAATFTLETLGKLDYSKRTESDVTSGGEKINFQIVNYADDNNPPQV